MLIGQKQNNSNRTMYAIQKEIAQGANDEVEDQVWVVPTGCGQMREHLVSDRTSRIFKHLHNSTQCRILCSDKCFSILDHASTTFQLKIEEF